MQPAAPIQTVQPIQVSAAPAALPRQSRYSCAVKSLGILQIILAGLSVVLGIAAAIIAVYGILAVASGAWGGLLFYLPAGILGVLSVTTRVTARRCLAIATMVMSIISSVMAGCNIMIYGFGIGGRSYYYSGSIIVNCLLVIASLTELVVSIVASAYCCYVMKEYRPTATTVHYGNPTMFAYNQQQVAYPVAALAPYQPAAAAPAVLVTNQAAPTFAPPSYIPMATASVANTDETGKGNSNLA